jgi:AbrB family looped-hinge helix DNA binding protein
MLTTFAALRRASGRLHRPSSAVRPLRWYDQGIRATIDKAGRLVIPKALRDRLGLRPGVVEVVADGTGIRVEPLAEESLEEQGGRLVIPRSGTPLDDNTVRALRDADQR